MAAPQGNSSWQVDHTNETSQLIFNHDARQAITRTQIWTSICPYHWQWQKEQGGGCRRFAAEPATAEHPPSVSGWGCESGGPETCLTPCGGRAMDLGREQKFPFGP